ncbi:uncharacterized protein [Montipora foliosa]|uniref:uncharacterized protein isoform X2 n=2 Tax=Montipora TaxID=46703 RepID=UPI0035F1D4F5
MDKYASMVQKLVSLSVKLVAVDFDLTIINIHTRGNWQFTAKSLASRVRPTFKLFLAAALECKNLHVAVVTQSPQVSLVREVLEETFPESDTGRIHIRGTDGTWREVKGVTREGKQQHIESVVSQIKKEQKLKIKRDEVILLDDDQKNVELAESCKMRALHITGDDSLDRLLELRSCSSSL